MAGSRGMMEAAMAPFAKNMALTPIRAARARAGVMTGVGLAAMASHGA
jgi:hypothetical protein